MEERDRDSRLRDSWSANAGAWTRAVREERIESRRLGTDEALRAAVLARGPGRLLDVGCGEGWLARALAPQDFVVVGVDGSAKLIDAARALGGGHFEVVDYDQLMPADGPVPGPFDTIVCNFSLLSEHLVPLLQALARRLAADGELIIQTVHPFTAVGDEPYEDAWREEEFGAFGDPFPAAMPWFYRTMGSWIRELAAAGLVVTDCQEPVHPGTGRPLSLLLVAEPRPGS